MAMLPEKAEHRSNN